MKKDIMGEQESKGEGVGLIEAKMRLLVVGMDLGDKYSSYCVLDADSGEVVEEGRVGTKEAEIRAWLRGGGSVVKTAKHFIPGTSVFLIT